MRIIGVDYGQNVVGLAVGSTIMRIASPLSFTSEHDAVAHIKQAAQSESATLIIVGLPRDDHGETKQSAIVRAWSKVLETELGIPVELVDEFGTTQIALERLRDRGVDRAEAKQNGSLDIESAVILLQSYLSDLKLGSSSVSGD